MHMPPTLTPELRSRLSVALIKRRRQLESGLSEHTDEFADTTAGESADQMTDENTQRNAEREIDLTLSSRWQQELAAVHDALLRLTEGEFGRCPDCGVDIPVERLLIEPWAPRCVACEGARERADHRAL